jgi:uncharacterized MAPEG superfamily protein
MSASAVALLGYIGWTLALLLVMETMRSWLVLSGRRETTDFQPDGRDVSPFAHRLARAHANCYESFPIIGGLLILAIATGQTALTDPLAAWLLAARIAQSSIHLVSIGAPAVRARFMLFVAQLLIAAWWSVALLIQWVA